MLKDTLIFLSKYFTSDTFLTQARIITLTELMTYLQMPALVQAWHVPCKNSNYFSRICVHKPGDWQSRSLLNTCGDLCRSSNMLLTKLLVPLKGLCRCQSMLLVDQNIYCGTRSNDTNGKTVYPKRRLC